MQPTIIYLYVPRLYIVLLHYYTIVLSIAVVHTRALSLYAKIFLMKYKTMIYESSFVDKRTKNVEVYYK